MELEPHIGTQKCLFEEGIEFDDIIKLEDLDSEISELNRKYGLNLQLRHEELVRAPVKKEEISFVGYLPYSEVSKRIPPYRYFYDDETILGLLCSLFQDDLAAYDYEFLSD